MILPALALFVADIPVVEAWRDRGVAPGTWTYAAAPLASVASYGGRVEVRCDKMTRRLSVVLDGQAMPGTRLLISTTNGDRWLPQPAAWHASDAIGDWMAFSRGRILFLEEGHMPLVVPSWPRLARVVEDCRV
ncbi:hypothetical protein [Sphingomicrobium nitratireducens]|uniref:hypothetical protein n=1 Tax=Sphingomicrobium nitratireducens TaxID=2964666 RepID=UPI0022409FAB|nr:hypothetical protein [Sphingomicrobium nitratireducens]